MANVTIEQALYGSQEMGGYRFLGRSPGFAEDWLPEAERLCTGFGERPTGVSCPACVFARPFGSRHVAVVQVADQGADDRGRPGALGFRLLVVPTALYEALGANPFLLADHFPPCWEARGELPTLEWTAGPPTSPSVQELRTILKGDGSPPGQSGVEGVDSATLLGGVQALVDGGRLVFERPTPHPKLIRDLWDMLPRSTRAEQWPATFAFGNAHQFDVLVVPQAGGEAYAGYLQESQAGDYPAGSYELALQTAIENEDQAEVDALLARRSRSQTLRLAVGLLIIFLLVPFVFSLLERPEEGSPKQQNQGTKKIAPLRLPPPEECPPLPREERQALARHIHHLTQRLPLTSVVAGVGAITAPVTAEPWGALARTVLSQHRKQPGPSQEELTDALGHLDVLLGSPESGRDRGPLRKLGPLQRQVRALLWKHGTPEYALRELKTPELMERLERRLIQKGILQETGSE